MVTRNRASFMPTRIDRATYGTFTINSSFSFTNFVREDDYSEGKGLWVQEVGIAVKKWNKFKNDGEVNYLAIKGQIEQPV